VGGPSGVPTAGCEAVTLVEFRGAVGTRKVSGKVGRGGNQSDYYLKLQGPEELEGLSLTLPATKWRYSPQPGRLARVGLGKGWCRLRW